MTKIIFSRKGFDSSTGGIPSYKRDETLISFPIPSQKNTLTTYNDCRLGKYVKEYQITKYNLPTPVILILILIMESLDK